MKKNILLTVVIVIIFCAGAFYGGMKYGQSKTPQFPGFPQDRAARMRGQGGGLNGGSGGANFAGGEIISKDDKSITVKMRDGGSKIIFISKETKISKNTDGTNDDLKVGASVMVNGKSNSDGSLSATSVQLNSGVMMPPPKISL